MIHIILMLLLFFLLQNGAKEENLDLCFILHSFFIFYHCYDFVVIELCDRILLCVLHVEEQVQMEREEKIHGSGTTTKLTRKKMFQTFLCW